MDINNEILEKLASLEHAQWMRWAKTILETETISDKRRARWETDCFKPYSELSEEMKEFDRKEVMLKIHVLKEL